MALSATCAAAHLHELLGNREKGFYSYKCLYANSCLPIDMCLRLFGTGQELPNELFVFMMILVPEQLEHFSHFCLGMSRVTDLCHYAEDTNKQMTVATCGC